MSLDQRLGPELLADPYPFYHRLRAADPVHWNSEFWVLTRYSDVAGALNNPRLSVERILPANADPDETDPVFLALSKQMLFRDPPAHTRLRSLVSRAFTPRVVEEMRQSVQETVDSLLDKVGEEMDLIADFAKPLPVAVISDMLGVPPEERRRLAQWSDDFVLVIAGRSLTPEEQARLQESLPSLGLYFFHLAEGHSHSPGNDLMHALLTAEDRGDALSPEELIANAILLLVAGHETTTNLIGNGMLALLNHPNQWRLLLENSVLLPGAVEELLRYDSPVQDTDRVAREDLEIGGRLVSRGAWVRLVLGAANRDPAQFPNPDTLDIRRGENRHLAFGYGPHFCLGAALARLEAQIAIGTLARRMPGIRLAASSLEWHETLTLRGLKALPVRFR